MALPILLMVNFYTWINGNSMGTSGDFTFKGFNYIHQYFSTFPGIQFTLDMFRYIQETSTEFTSIEINSLGDLFEAVNTFFTMVGLVFSIPIMILVDIIRNILWVLQFFIIE